jgi:hypothetical protein
MTLTHAYLSKNIADLAEIYRSDINVCVVERSVSNDLTHFIQQLLSEPRTLNLTQVIATHSFDLQSLLPKSLHFAGYQDFCRDIAYLIDVFSDLFELKTVGLRLGLLDKAMCPRFHVDRVPCRLVCTYGGMGTEWLEEAYVNRAKLGRHANGLKDEDSGAILDSEAIEKMPAFAIGLLKGTAWEGNEDHGAVHRSPTLTAQTPRRLLFTLDFG